MGNHRLPIAGHQPRSQKAGRHPKGVARPISECNLALAYEPETWRPAGCRHDQQQTLLRWWDFKWISAPFDCLQRSLGHWLPLCRSVPPRRWPTCPWCSGAACVYAPDVIKLVVNGDEASHLPDEMIAEILD